jgi:hypothetical protein
MEKQQTLTEQPSNQVPASKEPILESNTPPVEQKSLASIETSVQNIEKDPVQTLGNSPGEQPGEIISKFVSKEEIKNPESEKKQEKVDPLQVKQLSEDYSKLKESHESLLASIEKAREHRTVQVIRAAGVEALADEEILQLAPKVDPNSPEGINKINEWIDNHPSLVSPKYRMQAPNVKQLAESAIENHAVQSIFGNAETVRTRIKTIFGGE